MASDEKLPTSPAPEKPQAECYFCHKLVDADDHHCYGCNQVVCDGCDKNVTLMGRHSPSEHLEDYDDDVE